MTSHKTDSNDPDIPGAPALPDTSESREPVAQKESKAASAIEDNAAVDDIVAHEGDELLANQDEALAEANPDPDARRGFKQFLVSWWRNKWARWGTIVGLLVLLVAVIGIPGSRYFVLNSVGVRSSASVVVLDGATQLPLKNVAVSIGDKQALTDVKGTAKLTSLKLGKQKLTIRRVAFAQVDKTITLGWGSNPLGSVGLRATGVQYTILLRDYLSGKPVTKAEATNGSTNALSDKNGKVVLTQDASNEANVLTVSITADGYRNETIELHADNATAVTLTLVPVQKEVFVTKQSGTYDLYAMDLDGKNKQLLAKGTGLENANIALAVSPGNDTVAMVSTRDNMRDNDGYLLSALTLISLKTGAPLILDHAEQIQLVGWSGTRIIYQATGAGASAANAGRYRLMSYDYKANARVQMAAANQFNMVVDANNMVYYANSSTDPTAQLGMFRIKPDGTSKQTLFDKEVWTGFRTAYTTLTLQTPDGWYAYTLGSQTAPTRITSTDGAYTNRRYLDSPDGSHSAWVDSRDGKGALISYDIKAAKDAVLQTQDGLTQPVRWLGNNVLLYRVANAQETADYAVSTNGGPPKKIGDVTNTYGYGQGY